jgi:hypothetical protein
MAVSPSTRYPKLFIYMRESYGFAKALGIGLYGDVFYAECLRAKGAYADLASITRTVFDPNQPTKGDK